MAETETVDTTEKTESNNSERSLDYEALASELGWVPEDKFRGDKEKWRDAKSFYEKGEMVLPLVKKQRDEFRGELGKTQKELAELRSTMQDVIKFNEAAAERKFKEQLAALKEVKAAAVEAGDKVAFQRAEDAIDELKESAPKKTESKTVEKPTSGDPDFESWVAENDWYTKDAKKRRLANSIGIDLVEENPNLKGKALYKAVTDEIERIETEKSGVERAGPQRGGKTTSSNPKARTFDNLLPEFKQAYEKWTKRGITMTKEQYIAKCDPEAWGA